MSNDPMVPKPAKGASFRRVTRSFNTAGGARRGKPKATAGKSGAIRTNTDGKELVLTFMGDEGQNPHDFQVAFGANEELGQLAIYAPRPGDAGLMKATIYENGVAFHAGAAFEDYPALRPSATVDCHMERSVDAEGVDCIIIQIHGAAPTRTVKRKKSNS